MQPYGSGKVVVGTGNRPGNEAREYASELKDQGYEVKSNTVVEHQQPNLNGRNVQRGGQPVYFNDQPPVQQMNPNPQRRGQVPLSQQGVVQRGQNNNNNNNVPQNNNGPLSQQNVPRPTGF